MGPDFKESIRKELHDLLRRGTWRLVERSKAQGSPLPLKCKARICVRGDLQDEDDGRETYAATLAAKTFRIVMAIAARFGLDVRQFDVGNAFLYSDLKKDHPVYVRLPQGFALYGIDRTDEEPCVFTNGKILALVYVDDILILNPRQEKKAVNDLVQHLQSKYDLREEEFKWYLGIRVVRDRPNRKIYLCQDAYVEKIARKFKLSDLKLRVPSIPIATIPLVKYNGQATKEEIKATSSSPAREVPDKPIA
ncbi:reverse transcriptase (RNA-dependent DNA polymerase) [Hirsutella rhossiliensis]